MVRRYRTDPVDPNALDRILDAARRGPSAGFAQGVELIIVTSDAGRSRLAAEAHEADYTARGFEPWLSAAPIHVVVTVDPSAYERRYAEPDKSTGVPVDRWPVPYWWVDAGAALMLILLATAAENLAAGFLGSHAFGDLAAAVRLPPGREAIGVVTIGHEADSHAVGSARRPRRPRSAVEHSEQWGIPRQPGQEH